MSDFRPMGTRVSSHSARRQPTIALDSSAAVGMTVGSARPLRHSREACPREGGERESIPSLPVG